MQLLMQTQMIFFLFPHLETTQMLTEVGGIILFGFAFINVPKQLPRLIFFYQTECIRNLAVVFFVRNEEILLHLFFSFHRQIEVF